MKPVHDTSLAITSPLAIDVEDAVERTLGAVLTPNEERVLRLRFGLGAQPHRTVEIARRLGLRVTTVLRLQRRAVRKLRAAALAAEAEAEPHRWLTPLADTPPLAAGKECAARI